MTTATFARYRFTFGPWNISTGADPFGPPVRAELALAVKLREFKKAGFDGIQLHDDDVVPADWDSTRTAEGVKEVKKMLDDEELFVEFVAPRLWEEPRTIDGAFTSNRAEDRQYALDRSRRAIDIANQLGTRNLVLWLAREGTYIREAKDPIRAVGQIVDALDTLLEHDANIRLLGEMKPNEPMDQAYLPTVGHFIGLISRLRDPERVGVLVETAHSILAGLDPSDDLAYALWHQKLWGVHLNDQNGLKFDQDKTFGSVDLRRAFNIVWVLDRSGYGWSGECIGLDVKPMRTTRSSDQTRHLINSKALFLRLSEVVQQIDDKTIQKFRGDRDYEGLEMYILDKLLGR
ncbi:MAG TPA: TIM barrel protein [Gemmatales bacterium]|nr:TIM barrel protein [Gemmatales bacterium]HMP60730.1 TIM barrel protein [Gemmatales bacterium]